MSSSTHNNEAAVPKYEWDFDVPNTPFWKDMEFKVAKNFLNCFQPEEVDKIHFDATLSVQDRLRFLLSQLQSRLDAGQAAAAPQELHVAQPEEWFRVLLGIETMQRFLDLPQEEAQTIRLMLATTTGSARFSWLNMLSELTLRNKDYAEAESLAREVLPWIQTHEKMGVDAPQAFGTTKILIECLWKQGGAKRDEARLLLDETFVLIDSMGKSRFSKYQEEEREMLRDLKARLEADPPAV